MSPSYEAIEECQRLVKNAISQNLFCCQTCSINQLNMLSNYLDKKKGENRPF